MSYIDNKEVRVYDNLIDFFLKSFYNSFWINLQIHMYDTKTAIDSMWLTMPSRLAGSFFIALYKLLLISANLASTGCAYAHP